MASNATESIQASLWSYLLLVVAVFVSLLPSSSLLACSNRTKSKSSMVRSVQKNSSQCSAVLVNTPNAAYLQLSRQNLACSSIEPITPHIWLTYLTTSQTLLITKTSPHLVAATSGFNMFVLLCSQQQPPLTLQSQYQLLLFKEGFLAVSYSCLPMPQTEWSH